MALAAAVAASVSGLFDTADAVANLLVRTPLLWLKRCCVRRSYSAALLPLQLRYESDTKVVAAARIGEFAFPLLTMTIYGATHYIRWAHLARAVGVRIPPRCKALVAGSYLLLPNLLVPVLDVRCLHMVLVTIVTINNLILYREFCIMEQLHVYGRRLPGEPVLVGMLQAVNVLHDAAEEPMRLLWRKVRRHVPTLLTPGRPHLHLS